MTYVAAVIGDNPQNYWRLNEGPGATAALDYGNEPGMLWLSHEYQAPATYSQLPGSGFGGITADGGAWNVGAGYLVNRKSPSGGAQNPFTPVPDPGSLECWVFGEEQWSSSFVGWHAPALGVGAQSLFGMATSWNTISWSVLGGAGSSGTLLVGQWNHVAMNWSNGVGSGFVNGVQGPALSGFGPVGGGGVDFLVGNQTSDANALNVGGLVSEVATYRTALTAAQLQAHISQAELRGQRPHWVGPRIATSGSTAPPVPTYSLGVTHVNLASTATFAIPKGLRGLMFTIVSTPANHRQLQGQPPYDWDVGWVTVSDSNGMIVQQRITRDRQVWLDFRIAVGNTVGYFLEPSYVINITELDPA